MAQKSVLITGCSEGGIGGALAAEFHARGCRVFATARNLSKMESLAEKGVETIELDVTSDESIARALAIVRKATGGSLDLLINNAGINHVLPFIDMTMAEIRHVLDTNIVAVFAVTHAFLPLLVQAKGTVASLGSINEIFCQPFQGPYSASKAAVHAMGSTLRKELAPLGVNFVTLMIGAVRTKLFENTPTKEFPENSVYKPIAKSIEEREFFKDPMWMDVDLFARQIVSDLLKPKPRNLIWRGGGSMIAWFLSWLGWEGMTDSVIIRYGGLNSVRG